MNVQIDWQTEIRMNQWHQQYSVSTSYRERSSMHSSGGKRGTAGYSWLALKCKKKPIQPSIGPSTQHFIMWEMAENDPFMMACIMHCLTNHTPTGEYHRWFFPDQPTHCPHCTDHIYHTRSHILASCGKYASPFTSTQMIYSDKNSAHLKTLLKKNPTAFISLPTPCEPHTIPLRPLVIYQILPYDHRLHAIHTNFHRSDTFTILHIIEHNTPIFIQKKKACVTPPSTAEWILAPPTSRSTSLEFTMI